MFKSLQIQTTNRLTSLHLPWDLGCVFGASEGLVYDRLENVLRCASRALGPDSIIRPFTSASGYHCFSLDGFLGLPCDVLVRAVSVTTFGPLRKPLATGRAMVVVNLCGFENECIYDGPTYVFDCNGNVAFFLSANGSLDASVLTFDAGEGVAVEAVEQSRDRWEECLAGLVAFLRTNHRHASHTIELGVKVGYSAESGVASALLPSIVSALLFRMAYPENDICLVVDSVFPKLRRFADHCGIRLRISEDLPVPDAKESLVLKTLADLDLVRLCETINRKSDIIPRSLFASTHKVFQESTVTRVHP